MDQDHFSKLAFSEQITVMERDGILLCKRDDGINRYFLFQLYSFYVEGKFHIKASAIQGIKTLTNIEDLDVYLAGIDISDLSV